jgi:uncharacterized protein RhaS with RHS repeats
VIGSHQNYFRDYDPAVGRYVESDPIGLRAGINTYGYVKNNPIVGIDPLGLLTWKCIASSATGIGYRGTTKLCRYFCSATCTNGNGLSTSIDSPGYNTSGGSHCEGVPIGTQFTPGGQISDNPTGPPRSFSVDTDGLKGLWDWLQYSSDLTAGLKQAENGKCCGK